MLPVSRTVGTGFLISHYAISMPAMLDDAVSAHGPHRNKYFITIGTEDRCRGRPSGSLADGFLGGLFSLSDVNSSMVRSQLRSYYAGPFYTCGQQATAHALRQLY